MSNNIIQSGIFTTLSDKVAYTDIGQLFDSLNIAMTINGIKTYTNTPQTLQTSFTNPNQLVIKDYVDKLQNVRH